MKIIYNDNPFFNISLENIFSAEELKIIFKEINELKKHFKDPNFTASASTHIEVLKKNTGMFLSESETYENLKTIKIIDKCIKNNKSYYNKKSPKPKIALTLRYTCNQHHRSINNCESYCYEY